MASGTELAVSPLAPEHAVMLPPLAGVKLAAAGFELRYKHRPDLLLVVCDEGTACAGVFTTSTTAAAPVQWCREALKSGRPHVLVANAGQANAFTGQQGLDAVAAVAADVAAALGCAPQDVLMASTGVIGQHLPLPKLREGVKILCDRLSDGGWDVASEAIRTTDTFPKRSCRAATIGGVPVTFQGIAKGSGMIAPNMATLLAFVFTDAAIEPAAWQAMLAAANELSFNAITVDGDCSTNDTLLGFATAKAGNVPIAHADDPAAADAVRALREVLIDLAQQVVRDGEGAQKLITVQVRGAVSDASAKIMALSIANSPLIKTAIAGEDANWGRVVMAIGKTGEPVVQDAIGIAFGGYPIAHRGAVIDGYDEAPVAAYMKGRDIVIEVVVGEGAGSATVWTCDLTHGYIAINADYRS